MTPVGPPRTDHVGYWAALGATLAGVGVTFLIAASQTAGKIWVGFLVTSGSLAALCAAYVFSALFIGRGLPDLGEVRRAKKAEREHVAMLDRFARHDALQELIDELDNNARDLGIELGNDRIFGVSHPGNAWEKNRHVLRDHLEIRALVQDAYQLTHALNQRAKERYDTASHEDANNPAWQKLTEEETQEREEALSAVQKAKAAVQEVLDSARVTGSRRLRE
jgi:hypothetical protein